ncbi:DUF5958 family protein [Spirosoma sp.]|uniref:DUF5958 family protein n=1 Tax=Spirosoma sp. TaxID=1899569 RepID=UPI003B3B2A65
MNFEDEIVLYQFAQGVYPMTDLRDQFSLLSAEKQRKRFVHFYCKVYEYAFTDADIDKALADCSLDATDAVYDYLNLRRLVKGPKNVVCIPHSASPPEGRLDKVYGVLLNLFKINYQRQYALGKTNPTDWQYRDLSNPEIVQEIGSSHQTLLDEVYTNPSYRSEFASMAKLWYEQDRLSQSRYQEPEPAPERQTTFDFITYDELINESNKLFEGNSDEMKLSNAFGMLRQSVEKGLAKRYGLPIEKARKLLFDVMERHLRETYNVDLFD